MRYRNKKTGFILNTSCECKGEGWEELIPSPKTAEKEEKAEEKPKRTKK